MTDDWRVPADDVTMLLLELGLELSPAEATARTVVAGGTRGAAYLEVAVDATGRIRATVTWMTEDVALEPLAIGERRFSRVRSAQTCTTVTGELGSVEELRELVQAMRWVQPTDDGR